MTASQVLLIDGDVASRNYIQTALNLAGYSILLAASGQEGLIAAWRDRPDLIIIDPALSDLTGEEMALHLRSDHRSASVPLIAFSSDRQAARQGSCLQAGFNRYLLKSPQAVPLLLETVRSQLRGDAMVSPKVGGQLIVFLSAKGGTGTSSLCANLAMNMAVHHPEARLVLMDLVLPIGSIAGILGYGGRDNIVTITQQLPETVTPEFLGVSLPRIEPWHFHLLAGSPDPEHANNLVVDHISNIISSLTSTYDFVVVDLGRSLSRFALPLIEHADLITIVTATDLSSVTLTKTLWEYLHSKGILASSVFVILNRAVGLEGLTKPEAEKIIGIPINTTVPYLGGNFSMANNQHQPYSVKFTGDTASIILKDTAKQMLELIGQIRRG